MVSLLPKIKLRSRSLESPAKAKPSLSVDTETGAMRPSTSTTTDSFYSTTTSTTTSTMTKPVVQSPDWVIRYDPSLSVYYYINTRTNEAQFDHPDEVVASPLSSPITPSCDNYNSPDEHRKLLRSSSNALRRTFSPKRLGMDGGVCSGKKKNNRSHHSGEKLSDAETELNKEKDDEDVAEFKKEFDLEIQRYENERLQRV